MERINEYTIRLEWSPEDECYLAQYLELPSLITHGNEKNEALEELEEAAREAIKWMKEENEEIPEPLSKKKYKGNIALRLSPSTHRKVALAAAEQKVSVNQFITTLVEEGLYTDRMKSYVDTFQKELGQLTCQVDELKGMRT